MALMHDFDWYLERLDVARWESEEPGSRSGFFNCPVHGGSDSLHVTEKNGRALLKCFGCDASPMDVTSELESGTVEQPEEATVPFSPRPRGRRGRPGGAQGTPAGDVGSTPTASITDPLQWYADYCGVTVELLAELGVTVTEDGWLAHGWPDTTLTKDRQPGTDGRRWSSKGAQRPKLWPAVPDELPDTIWLAEGETDVIALRGWGLAAFTSGGASDILSESELRALHGRGVEHVVVAFDSDRAGQEGAEKLVKAARSAGIFTSRASLGDPFGGQFKDWREMRLAGVEEAPSPSADIRLDVWRLDELEVATDTAMLADHIHPTDHTILFGDGGTGKGAIAAQLVADLSRGKGAAEPLKILILDYEAHARHEWRKRVPHFGGWMKHVWIVQPTEPIWDIAQQVREVIEEHGINLVVVDSITYACVGEEVEKSATAAKYTVAISHLQRPVLSLAHTTKTDLGAKHPFGSIFWSNGARVTINVRVDGPLYNDPRVVECKKTNQQAPFAPYRLSWDWVDTELPGGPDGLWGQRTEMKIDWESEAFQIMVDTGGITAEDLFSALTAKLGNFGFTTLPSFRSALSKRAAKKGWAADESTNPALYKAAGLRAPQPGRKNAGQP